MSSDQNGEKPNSKGAVVSRQTSKPRNKLVTRPGGKAPAWLATMGAPKSTPLACVQRTAASRPAAAVAMAMKDASGTVRCTAPSPKPRYAGVVATVQTPAKIAGTAIDASLMRASENGRQRANPRYG